MVIMVMFFLILLSLILVSAPKKNMMLTNKIPVKADYAIIGCGASGCVLARRLADKYPNKKIVILEQGKDRRHEKQVYRTENAINIAYISPYSSVIPSNYDGVVCSFGTMYGGSTSHNFGLTVTGSDEFYENYWFDCLGINKGDLNKYKSRVISIMPQFRITPNLRFNPSQFFSRILTNGFCTTMREGLCVLLNVGSLGMDEKSSKIIVDAIKAESGDISVVDDYNKSLENICPQQILFVDPANGVRASSNRQYLPDHYLKRNLSLVESAKVSHVDKESNVILSNGNKIKADKIIFSAGSIHTPLILKRSFFNDENIKDKIGKGLFNHYGSQMILGMKDVSSFSSGPLAYIAEESKKRRKWQCLVVGDPLVNYGLLDKNGVDYNKLKDEGYTFISFILFILNPTGEGHVEDDKVVLNMYNDLDSKNIVDGMKWFERIFRRLQSSNNNDGTMNVIAGYPNEDQWEKGNLLQLAKNSLIITDHYSCTMNELIDKNFKLKGHDNIFVVDASIFPAIPDANTEFPTLLQAEIAADRL